MRAARRALPHRADITFNLAILAARLGQREEAEDLVERVLTTQADVSTVDRAREGILRTDLIIADSLLQEGDLESALEVIDAVIARTSDSVLFAQLSDKADEIRRRLELEKERALFEEAMELVRESRYDEAVRQLESIVASTTDPEMRRSARTMIRRLRVTP